ncbi:hypothetical protein [Spirosoma endbachense]|uniref:Lipoprotein n=1 Tax=Spirosoma endbachense TaxID=2666025 RepID=A0A6P1W2K2_9BACT|nr:hypothetical protein [Spirosoma endbachense]QHV98237.1 hypothetical protein GJR95_25970 [Spirosoma endbachense]
MKPFVQLVCICLITLLALAQACTPVDKGPNTKVDKKGGYKNLKLDAPYDSLKKLVTLNQTLDDPCTATKKFEITTEPYTTLSTIRLDKVEVEFVRDSLYRVILHKRYSYQVDRELHETYRAQFGQPSEERMTLAGTKYTTYKWIGAEAYIYIIQRDHADLDIEYGSFQGRDRSIDEAEKCAQRKLEKGDNI